MTRRWLALAFALAAGLAGGAAAAAPARDTAALERANALQADRARWDEAVAGYRALLDADPAWSAPRRQLARVLAWRGDYDDALAHYERLLEDAGGGDAEARRALAVERAEVLSWAGRSEPARAAFEAILAEHPDDARAARGLARVHRWAGERAEADAWYARSLAAEDDPEARREHAALRDELERQTGADARWFRDSDEFTFWRSSAEAGLELDFDTRVRVRTGTLRVTGDPEPGSPLAALGDESRAFDGRLALERRLSPRARATLEVGGRHWSHGRSRPLARAALELVPGEGTAFGFEVRHDDLLERAYSLASVLRGIGDTTLRSSVWRQLTPRLEGYAAAEGSLFTDGNGQAGVGGSLAFRPWPARRILLGLAGDVRHYGRDSAFYYAPRLDCSTTLSLAGELPLAGPLAFAFDVGGGVGYADDQGITSFGPAYRVKGGLRWQRDGISLALDLARAQSQRAITYTTHEVQLSFGWVF